MSQALYRTYRSRSLAEIVGQEHITQTLARALKAGRVSHAYLFTGPRGVGKTSVARILAHEINSLEYSDTPNLDIIEIDAASNRRIDDIRDLREKVYIAPVHAKYKVYIIDEVHMLTGESFNALLKTLEEPPAHVVFILATTEVHKLPATIISRTQRFTFKPGTQKDVTAHLKMIAQKENIKVADDALELIAERGDGSFRDSLSLLDQLAHVSDGNITATKIAEVLGLAAKESIDAIVTNLSQRNLTGVMRTLNMLDQGGSVASTVDQLARELLNHAQATPDFLSLVDKLLEVQRSYNPRLKLTTALASFCIDKSQATFLQQVSQQIVAPLQTAQTPATAPAQNPAPAQTHSPQPKPSPAATVTSQPQEQPPQEVAAVPISGDPLTDLSPEDWQRVLEAVRKKSPPIFAVLKQAQPLLDANGLTLNFKYALHSKKLEDVKQKAFLAELVALTLGKAAVINVAVNKDATPPEFAAAPPDPAIAAVAEIMGGGEVMSGA